MIARLTPTSTHTWPAFQGTLNADSLALGPVTLQEFKADVKVAVSTAEITSLDAGLLGGQIHVTGKLENGEKPSYSLEGQFENMNPADLCELLELKCTGASFDGNGKMELAGYAGKDLADSAKGTLHFDWKKGTVSESEGVPAVLGRFDQFTGDAEIANGGMTLKENSVQQGSYKGTVSATISFGEPPTVVFVQPKNATSNRK
jgi:hypothetical protein